MRWIVWGFIFALFVLQSCNTGTTGGSVARDTPGAGNVGGVAPSGVQGSGNTGVDITTPLPPTPMFPFSGTPAGASVDQPGQPTSETINQATLPASVFTATPRLTSTITATMTVTPTGTTTP